MSLTSRMHRARSTRRGQGMPPATRRRRSAPRRSATLLRGRSASALRRAMAHGPTLVLHTASALPANPPARPGDRRRLRLRIRIDIVLPLLLLVLSLLQNLDQVHVSPFHRDEARWIARAHFLEDLADPFGPTWNDYYLTNTQAPLGSYTMGLGLLLQGRDLHTNAIWDFNFGPEWNEMNGAMPVAKDLDAGRRMNALLGALVTLTVFFIGKRLGNRVGATLAAAFIALHPLHILMSSQALSDVTLTLLLALLFLQSIRLAQRPTWPNAVLIALLIGLGGSAKLSPLLLSLPLAGLGGLLLVRSAIRRWSDDPAQDRRLALKLLPQPIMAFIVFVAVFPYLWVDPLRRSYHMFTQRADEMLSQGTIWPDLAVNTPLQALARIGLRLNETSTTSGRLEAAIMKMLSIDHATASIDFLPAIAGVVILGALVVRYGLRSQYSLVSLLMFSEVGAIAVGMKADFNRYHLPIVLVMSICIAVSMSGLWNALGRLDCWRALNLLPGIRVSSHAAPAERRALVSPRAGKGPVRPARPVRRPAPTNRLQEELLPGSD